MVRKFNHAAYRRNVRKACAILSNRIPQAYTTAIATCGDFIVYSNGSIVGRLPASDTEAFA